MPSQTRFSLHSHPHVHTPCRLRRITRHCYTEPDYAPPISADVTAIEMTAPAEMARAQGTAKFRILEELELVSDPFYTLNDKLKPDIQELIASNPSAAPGPDSLTLGQGEWQVFHAPHIVNLSSSFGARFDPIRYRLEGNKLSSNVKYTHPILGSGWLSASGTFTADGQDNVVVHFDKFWVDVGGTSLRENLEEGEGGSIDLLGMLRGEYLQNADAIVGTVGRSAFFPQLASFPVQYVDEDLAVFQFQPLKSSIAVRKMPVAP